MAVRSTSQPAAPAARPPRTRTTGQGHGDGDFIDVILILLTSVALTFVIFFLASRVAHVPMIEALPEWMTNAFGQVWAVVTASAVGLGAAIIRSISRGGKAATSVLVWVGAVTLTLLVLPLLVALALRSFKGEEAPVGTNPGKPDPPVTGIFRTLPPYLKGDEAGIGSTRKSFDFNGDKVEDHCRIVEAGQYYFLCSSAQGANWDDVGEFTLEGWSDTWIDWDRDGFMDWCRITGVQNGPKYLTCSFTDGRTVVAGMKVQIDAGFPKTGKWPTINGTGHYCRTTGHSHEFFRCLPAAGRSIGREFDRSPTAN